ncbi:cutinase family protein [Candidatus Saccharibacteria bacterium]|nr:cutinase family protein [Candidatus Saccharibacteria bacterium]
MKSLKKALLLFFVPILAGIISSNTVNSLDDSSCKDYELIFARGSGQDLNDKDFRAVKAALKSKISEDELDFYELGENGGYKAVSIDVKIALGAYISAGNSYEFGASVESGVKELLSHINSETKRCKNKRFILAGYSQGALVVDKSLSNINSSKIVYVGNFGDPKLYLPEGNRACENISLSSYRVYVPDCNVEEGVLGGLKPYQPAGYAGKLGVWCNKTDFMCGSSLNLLNIFGSHTAYDSENGYEKFAEIVFSKINGKTSSETEARYSDSEKREIVVLFDHYMFADAAVRASYKTIEDDLKELLVNLAAHGTRIAIYNSYGLTSPLKYLEEKISFTNDHLAEKIDQLNRENALASGWVFSGSFDNNYYAVKKLSESNKWSTGSARHVFLLSNAYHDSNVSFDGTNLNDAIKIAKKNHVYVSLLSNNAVRYLQDYHDLVVSTGGMIVARDYKKVSLSKVKSSQKSRFVSKTFQINQDSFRTLVIVNDRLYGFSDNKTITITGLNENVDNNIRFVAYDSDGNKIGQKVFNFPAETMKTPDTGIAN